MDKTISYYIKDFSKTKNPLSLIKSMGMIIKEGRLSEVMFGLYTFLFYKPSKVIWDKEKEAFFDHYVENHLKKFDNGFNGLIYPEYLEQRFYNRYDFSKLPKGVRFRLPTILEGDDWLILGEYGDASGRIFFFKNGNFQVIDFYNKIKGFRHIHCVHPDKGNKIFITTGDETKFIDLWDIKGDKLLFVKRLKSSFAGYTAAVKIDGIDYFGTDFSQRPNYILRWADKKKFFFPEKTITMYVEYFEVIENRYIMSLNMHIKDFGGKAVIIFDAKTEKFVYFKELEKVNGIWNV